LNWDDYRYFLAVARTGKLSLAGQQLSVDHATVGRRVKALEESLKIHLFDRSPQGYSLTDAGQSLVNIAESMETGAIAAQTEFGGEADSVSGVVRVGAPEGMATSILAECAAELCEEHPRLELQIVAMPRTFSLSKREADIAIAVSAPTSGRLKYRKISDYTLHLYGTKEYLAAQPDMNEVTDLKKIRVCMFNLKLLWQMVAFASCTTSLQSSTHNCNAYCPKISLSQELFGILCMRITQSFNASKWFRTRSSSIFGQN